ncbi:ATP-binding protein [Dactylosporangium sp. CA-052675]|uniref:ATP-binding protein n=1 Tax=Dactylosporangium sp. CA-052675 TaxID=3239927 RepID=UPI003D930503
MNRPEPPTQDADDRPDAAQPGAVVIDQPFDLDSLYQLRAVLAAHAATITADKDQLDSLLIVAGELAANAVRHGGGSGRLRLWNRQEVLYCQVSDDGPGLDDATVGHIRPDPARGPGGLGLWLCRQLTSELHINPGRPTGAGTTVLAVIPPVADR